MLQTRVVAAVAAAVATTCLWTAGQGTYKAYRASSKVCMDVRRCILFCWHDTRGKPVRCAVLAPSRLPCHGAEHGDGANHCEVSKYRTVLVSQPRCTMNNDNAGSRKSTVQVIHTCE